MRKMVLFSTLATLLSIIAAVTAADACSKTTYPVFLVHGAWGFDRILGFEYFADDYGTFVGNPCREENEVDCNPYIDSAQEVHALSIHTVQSSEYRGREIADQIETYMRLYGYRHVNIIGHAQGGVCIRKAAGLLGERFGYPVVRVLISICSPHRGTPVVKTILEENPDIDGYLAQVLGDDVYYEDGNDGYASLTSMIYDDFDPDDGVATGAKQFNVSYPVSSRYAGRYASVLCARNTGLSPFVASFNTVIDGDGYCVDDCDQDGAAGRGDGDPSDRDDDGFVGINSQQMGYRLAYLELPFYRDLVLTDLLSGYVGDMNNPNRLQMTSLRNVLDQDHFNVVGYGPDDFDELKFFGALFDYIALND